MLVNGGDVGAHAVAFVLLEAVLRVLGILLDLCRTSQGRATEFREEGEKEGAGRNARRWAAFEAGTSRAAFDLPRPRRRLRLTMMRSRVTLARIEAAAMLSTRPSPFTRASATTGITAAPPPPSPQASTPLGSRLPSTATNAPPLRSPPPPPLPPLPPPPAARLSAMTADAHRRMASMVASRMFRSSTVSWPSTLTWRWQLVARTRG